MSRQAMKALTLADPTLGEVLRRVGPIELERERQTPYQALVRAVVYQQLNGRAASAIFARVKALFPGKRFPKPEDLVNATDDFLRSAGLSRAKTAALKAIAAGALDGTIPSTRVISRLEDHEIVERLTTLRGVGPWTVEMYLIFTLGRPDVLPATDYGVRKGFAQTFGLGDELPTPKALLAHGERWRPYRSFAAISLWRALDGPAGF